jgi:hypothetical protein
MWVLILQLLSCGVSIACMFIGLVNKDTVSLVCGVSCLAMNLYIIDRKI